MAWRDDLARVTLADGRRLIGASFRGVPFLVESSDRSGGRRAVVHEYPGRNEPAIDDLGRAATRYALEGYVVGDDYLAARDALLEALEEPGPGELVHPYYGVVRAVCLALTVRESRLDGGIATFALEFARSYDAPAPVEATDLEDTATDAADAALEAAQDDMTATYDVDGQPQYALDSLESEIAAAGEAMDAALTPLATGAQEAARVAQQTEILTAQASSIARDPVQLFAVLANSLGAVAGAVAEAPRALISALADSYALIGQTVAPTGTTPVRLQEAVNRLALIAVMRQTLAIEAARVIVQIDYETLDDARADATVVAELLEEQEAVAGTASFPALALLRARTTRAVPGDRELARVATLNLRVAVNSLVLSHRLYGSVDNEADLIARNNPRDPSFISGNVTYRSV